MDGLTINTILRLLGGPSCWVVLSRINLMNNPLRPARDSALTRPDADNQCDCLSSHTEAVTLIVGLRPADQPGRGCPTQARSLAAATNTGIAGARPQRPAGAGPEPGPGASPRRGLAPAFNTIRVGCQPECVGDRRAIARRHSLSGSAVGNPRAPAAGANTGRPCRATAPAGLGQTSAVG